MEEKKENQEALLKEEIAKKAEEEAEKTQEVAQEEKKINAIEEKLSKLEQLSKIIDERIEFQEKREKEWEAKGRSRDFTPLKLSQEAKIEAECKAFLKGTGLKI